MMTYVYNNNVVSPFSWGVSMGDGSKNVSNNFVSNNFVPFVFFPMGKAICMLDPSYIKNRAPEDLHLGGGLRHPVPPPNPPPYSTDRGVGGR